MTYDLFKAMQARPHCDLINPHLLIIHFPSSVAHCHFQKKQSLHIVPLIWVPRVSAYESFDCMIELFLQRSKYWPRYLFVLDVVAHNMPELCLNGCLR